MKRLLMGFAACALVMTSCSKQEITENVDDGQGQLSFSPGLGKQSTKASELTNTSLKGAATNANTGIALRTYQETTTPGTYEKWFVDDLWCENNVWKIGSTRFRNTAATKYITYFPKTGVTPVVNSFENATFVDVSGVFPAFTYTVGATSATQTDLLAGITNVEAKKTDIVLGMRHILSQVNFGTVAYNGANIAIRNIKIVGLYDYAKFTYKAKDEYPIGTWNTYGTGTTEVTRTASYDYFNHSNATATENPQPVVPSTAVSGDKYIFGDGGNWGPGKVAKTFYPVGQGTGVLIWEEYDTQTPQTALGNSLILMPQTFTGIDGAKVTFEYRITDKDNAYVAGTPNEWAKGEFKLDFTTGSTLGTHYMAQWDANYRYVYMIDFTDFLDGNALKFSVNVDMYPWENHDGGTGEVEIKVAGQPTQTNMNAIDNGNSWYIATQTKIAPITAEWAQVIRDEVWDMSNYDFTAIAQSETFDINFAKVIFNTKDLVPAPTTITMTLPDGFTAAVKTGSTANITLTNNGQVYIISEGDKSTLAAITITNSSYYRTSDTLKAAIEAATNGLKLGYGGTEAIDLTTMTPPLTTAGETITVKFNSHIVPTIKVDGNWEWNATTRIATYTVPVP